MLGCNPPPDLVAVSRVLEAKECPGSTNNSTSASFSAFERNQPDAHDRRNRTMSGEMLGLDASRSLTNGPLACRFPFLCRLPLAFAVPAHLISFLRPTEILSVWDFL